MNRSVDGMESKKDDSKVAQFGNLISPFAIAASLLFLFLATSSLDGRDLGNELNSAIFRYTFCFGAGMHR